jgi:hypothetical protein
MEGFSMSDRIQEYKDKLAASRQILDKILDQVGDRWYVQVYADGAAWNVRQLLIHLMDTERGQSNVIMACVRGELLVPEDFDVDRYNRRVTEKLAAVTPQEARATLTDLREMLNNWLDAIDESALDMMGRHASLAMLPVSKLLDIMAAHERTHANDIANVLAITV